MREAPERERALHAAADWAHGFFLPRRTFERAVLRESVEQVEHVRASFAGRTRRIVVRASPTASRSRTLAPPLDPALFDPWAVDGTELAAGTRRLAVCRACRGAKTVLCPECRGSGRVSCRDCSGAGRTYSARARGRQCRGCKGTGSRACRCRDGSVRCPACAGKGKAEEWLEVEEEPFTRIARSGENALSRFLEIEKGDARLEPAYRWRGRSVGEAPQAVRAVLVELARTIGLDRREDRVETIDLAVYRSVVTTVTYELFGAAGMLAVQAWDGQLRESEASRDPLRRWWRRLGLAAAGGGLLGLLIAAAYSLRHPFFLSTPNAAALWLAAPLLALALLFPLSRLALPGRARGRREAVGWSLPVLALLLGVALLALSGNPSLAHARELAAAGKWHEALTEADACVAMGRDASEAARLHDGIRLRRVREEKDAAAAWSRAGEKFFSAQARAQAREHALLVTVVETTLELSRGDLAAGEARLDLVPEDLRDDPRLRSLRFELGERRARGCLDRLDRACAAGALSALRGAGFTEADLQSLRREADRLEVPRVRALWQEIKRRGDIEARLLACRNIEEPVRWIETAGTGAEGLPIPKERIEKSCADLAEEKEHLEVRRQEREARASRSRQLAWDRAPLRCNDGSLSPSCICGESSHRGCCSHHGGVDGCSVPYPAE